MESLVRKPVQLSSCELKASPAPKGWRQKGLLVPKAGASQDLTASIPGGAVLPGYILASPRQTLPPQVPWPGSPASSPASQSQETLQTLVRGARPLRLPNTPRPSAPKARGRMLQAIPQPGTAPVPGPEHRGLGTSRLHGGVHQHCSADIAHPCSQAAMWQSQTGEGGTDRTAAPSCPVGGWRHMASRAGRAAQGWH